MVKCTVNLSVAEYEKLIAAITGSPEVTHKDVLVTGMGATVTVMASSPAALLIIGLKAGRALPAEDRKAVPGPAADTGKEGVV